MHVSRAFLQISKNDVASQKQPQKITYFSLNFQACIPNYKASGRQIWPTHKTAGIHRINQLKQRVNHV
ncbi:MAG TPA: hypothetical protein DD729_01150 [Rhodobacteraceae bacterium]|nr:hypothetical protein [Paracoccaceae bacterium]